MQIFHSKTIFVCLCLCMFFHKNIHFCKHVHVLFPIARIPIGTKCYQTIINVEFCSVLLKININESNKP